MCRLQDGTFGADGFTMLSAAALHIYSRGGHEKLQISTLITSINNEESQYHPILTHYTGCKSKLQMALAIQCKR
eukprot:2020017-Amphidinium_carterae.2